MKKTKWEDILASVEEPTKEFAREFTVDDYNRFICSTTELPLGVPTGTIDKNGNMIFSNDLLYDSHSHDWTAVVDVAIYDGEISYGFTNYHCGHCPLRSDLEVIGVCVDLEFNEVILYKDTETYQKEIVE